MRKTNTVPIYPEPASITQERINKLISTCDKIFDVCEQEHLTISEMQVLPDILSGEIRRCVNKQVADIEFRRDVKQCQEQQERILISRQL